MSKTEPKSWRDVITIHPAADLFPMMSPDELKALGEDIRRNGYDGADRAVVPNSRPIEQARRRPPQYYLLDGRNRLDAMEMVGITLIDASGETPAFHNWVWRNCRFGEGVPQINAMTGETSIERTDPYAVRAVGQHAPPAPDGRAEARDRSPRCSRRSRRNRTGRIANQTNGRSQDGRRCSRQARYQLGKFPS